MENSKHHSNQQQGDGQGQPSLAVESQNAKPQQSGIRAQDNQHDGAMVKPPAGCQLIEMAGMGLPDALARKQETSNEHLAEARRLAEEVSDADSRKMLLDDLATIS